MSDNLPLDQFSSTRSASELVEKLRENDFQTAYALQNGGIKIPNVDGFNCIPRRAKDDTWSCRVELPIYNTWFIAPVIFLLYRLSS
ncbi:MAG: hypothetical protein RL757_2220 [Bacteroidota bacterium]